MSRSEDLQHLRLLSIFHYVVAGIAGLMGFLPILHLGMGIMLVTGSFPQGRGQPPPPFMGWFFIFIAGGMMLMFWTAAVCIALAGWKLSQRRAYLFCLIVAFAECLIQPFGTVLGVFTIVVLFRKSVKELFGVARPEPQGPWDEPEEEGPGSESIYAE
jgi:hypothetical protein